MSLIKTEDCPICGRPTSALRKSSLKYEKKYVCKTCTEKLTDAGIFLLKVRKMPLDELRRIVGISPVQTSRLVSVKEILETEFSELDADLKKQDEAIELFQEARELEVSGNFDKAIELSRKALEIAPNSCWDSQRIGLAELYIKANRHNEAWGYLNRLKIEFPYLISKIEFQMCRILKKEKKWIEALRALMACHATKYGGFNEQAFIRDLGPIANRIPLIEGEPEYLADMLKGAPDDVFAAESYADSVFRRFYEERLKSRK